MHRLSTLLGLPQHRFASIHVVGTNGKSSVARMIAALLEAHGVSAGACLSPHAERWSERVLVRGEEIDAERFAAAVERATVAAETVNRGLAEGEAVTQFELATAAAFLAFADARVEAAAIEAGLGGRLDATNTIPSRVTVLTSIGLDHTEWLGESEEEIAAEKLAVLRDQTTLVLGRVSPAVRALAERTARERGARLVIPARPASSPYLGSDAGRVSLRVAGRFQQRNFVVSCAATEAFLGELDPERVKAVAAEIEIPGRLEEVPGEPPVLLDAAHNPAGARALAEALPEVAGDRPVIAVLAILADKDARAMIQALTPTLARAVSTQLPTADGPNPVGMRPLSAHRRSFGAAELAGLCADAGLAGEAVEDFGAALALARSLALELGGVVLVAGSHYALAPARAALGLSRG
jgi:dihydrofolate synthase/folylpolyglutamate synthase